MLIKTATTRECEQLFRRDLERRGHRFDHYKKKWQPLRAPITVSQRVSNQAVGTATVVTITTVAGSLLVIAAYQGVNNTSTLAITDSGGANVWTQVGGYGSASAVSRMAMFYCANAAAVTTVTATWSGAISATIPATVYEIKGILPFSPLDPDASNGGTTNGSGTGTSLVSAALSTGNVANILLCATGEGTSTTGWAGTNGFTYPAGSFFGTGGRLGLGSTIVTAVQSGLTTTTSWTTTGIDRISIIAAFMAGFVSPELTPGPGSKAIDSKYAVPY